MPERLEGRDGDIWRRYTIYSWTQERIAREYGISRERVSDILERVRASLPETDRSALINASMELIHEVKARALEIADMAGAPVAVGKDGLPLMDPETGAVVRDYSGRLRALETAMKADDVLAKRLGLDAAQKTETTASVRYEVVAVDPEMLK